MTNLKSVPGTLFFQSPEQETNVLELLVNVVQGSAEVEFFEDFYIQIAKNDTFSPVQPRRRVHDPVRRPRQEAPRARPAVPRVGEMNVRAKIRKSVGRPADIYSLGALFYYLVSGAYANPKTLYDAFHKFIEYENPDETNTIERYLSHEYGIIERLRAPKQAGGRRRRRPGRPVLLVQALPRRQRGSHRAARDEDHRAVHDPQQAGQLLPGARRRDQGHQRCSCRTSSTCTRCTASTRPRARRRWCGAGTRRLARADSAAGSIASDCA